MLCVGTRTVDQLPEYQVFQRPDHLALIQASEPSTGVTGWSYDEMLSATQRIAGGLRELGVREGDRVVLHMRNCADWLFAYFGILSAGGIVVPTITSYREDELTYVVNHTEARHIVTDAEGYGTARTCRSAQPLTAVVSGDTRDLPGGVHALKDLGSSAPISGTRRRKPDDLAMIMYTSGTTSRPKGVCMTHENVIFAAESNAEYVRMDHTDRHVVVLPLFHVNALLVQTLASFVAGGAVIVADRFSASRYWRSVRRYGATRASLVTPAIRALLAQPPDPQDANHGLRWIYFGLPLSEPEHRAFEQRFRVRLIEVWGMTETFALGTRMPMYGPSRFGCIGTPQRGVECRIADEDGRDVPPGAEGELLVRVQTMMPGYYRDPEATASAIRDGWLRTGDLARYDDDGFFYFIDRLKDVIKRDGENVAAAEVERVLGAHPSVAESAVIGLPDPFHYEKVVAFVQCKPGCRVAAAELLDFCRERLARFKVPERVEVLDDFPRTAIGKIQKASLKRRALAEDRT